MLGSFFELLDVHADLRVKEQLWVILYDKYLKNVRVDFGTTYGVKADLKNMVSMLLLY